MSTLQLSLTQRLNREIASLIKHNAKGRKRTASSPKITYSDFLSNKTFMRQVINEGVPYSLFQLIQDATPFTEQQWAKFLNVSTKSLQRYKQLSKTFKPIQSEKIIEIAEVVQLGLNVFGNMEKFSLWLNTPNYALGNEPPLQLLKDSYGKELVAAELTRVNYGILI
jgi:putative toxin-antitoxin system antitoxin component (TIGR02293 family)